MKVTCLLLVLALFSAGCASQPRMPTPSGRPEVTIPGKSAEELKTYFVRDLVARGYALRQGDPAAMVFEKRETGDIALLVQGDLDKRAWNRVTLSLVPDKKGRHRVICSAFLVGNRGTPYEQVREISGEWSRIQAWLEQAKSNIATATPR